MGHNYATFFLMICSLRIVFKCCSMKVYSMCTMVTVNFAKIVFLGVKTQSGPNLGKNCATSDSFMKQFVLVKINKSFKKILKIYNLILYFLTKEIIVFMIEVHILLNMFLNVISCEIRLPIYFEIWGFERQWGLSFTSI